MKKHGSGSQMFKMNDAACRYFSAGVNSWAMENENGLFIALEAALLSR